jgi:hypothetical protein
MGDEEKLLSELGLDFAVLDSGCCGMAGAFGFEKDHYDMSVKIGERVLLPAVQNAAKDALIIADGFSCREQIVQTTDRRALHVAQVLQMAMHEGNNGLVAEYPEAKYTHSSLERSLHSIRVGTLVTALGLGAGLGLVAAAVTRILKKRR